ncbi:hypothetical protein [Methanosarcina sp. 2.H.A.1B.4]|uniref:hypothetical protein n=1 Tax=Methanosarcina sp. 2.H.A.1B.4 TaxID=1483600 RepID=UPI001F343A54|nr:hypothetical protein [Methanosarcina sp. 2.H.A.1B.4]
MVVVNLKLLEYPSFLMITGGLKGSSERVRVKPPLFLPLESPDLLDILLISKARLYPLQRVLSPKTSG